MCLETRHGTPLTSAAGATRRIRVDATVLVLPYHHPLDLAKCLSTIDVLWCVALPVLDTLAVMTRRIGEGKSPFKPDRGHIHHLMLNAGLGPRAALALLIAMAIALIGIGVLTRRLTAGSNMLSFAALAVIYITMHGQVWRRQQAQLKQAQPDRRRATNGLPRTLTHLGQLPSRKISAGHGLQNPTPMRRKTDRPLQG